MKVLIITYYWPPAGGSGVQRWLKFVKYLGDFDIEPVVYCPSNAHYPIEDSTLVKELPKDLKIISRPIKEPNRLFSIFSSKKKKTSAGFLDSKPSLFGRLSLFIRANYFIPDTRKFWIKPSVKFLKKYLKENQIDLIISSGPPHSMHIIAMKLKQSMPIKWIADFRDPWTAIDYFYQLPFTKKALKRHFYLEQQVVKNADHILVVGNTMKENYKKLNNNITVITNGFDDFEMLDSIALDKKFSLVHIGMMNADRNPKTVFKVLEELIKEQANFGKDLSLKLIGKVAEEVKVSLTEAGLAQKVEMVDYLPHREVLKEQQKAQVLLLVVNNVPSAKGIITGKIFEYLNAKRPILAIAPTEGDLAKIINETSSGKVFNFEDKQLIKSHILELYQKFKNNNLMANTAGIEKYHRKNLTSQLAALIKKQLK